MPITHIVGCSTEGNARTAALEYDGFHTIIVGAADMVHLVPNVGTQSAPPNFGAWIMIATDAKIEAVTLPVGG